MARRDTVLALRKHIYLPRIGVNFLVRIAVLPNLSPGLAKLNLLAGAL